jgi:hypothetical protein
MMLAPAFKERAASALSTVSVTVAAIAVAADNTWILGI